MKICKHNKRINGKRKIIKRNFSMVCVGITKPYLLTNQITQFLWRDVSSCYHDNNIASWQHIRDFVCLQSSKCRSTRRLNNKTSMEKCLHCTVSKKYIEVGYTKLQIGVIIRVGSGAVAQFLSLLFLPQSICFGHASHHITKLKRIDLKGLGEKSYRNQAMSPGSFNC